MKEFFRGWRRKVGVMTLLLALITLSGWLTSFYREDGLEFCPDRSILSATSGYGIVSLSRFTFSTREAALTQSQVRNSPLKSLTIGWWSTPIKLALDPIEPQRLAAPDSDWKWGNFICGTASITIHLQPPIQFDRAYVIFPYWSLVVPLSLSSFWLLNSKPRKTKRSELVEPHPMSRSLES